MSTHVPRPFIEDLLARVDIVDIIQERISLKKAGKNWTANCPFHQEKTPSFHVSAVKQFYHCFGCHASGNVISFLMNFDRLNFIESLEYLAQRTGLTIPYQKLSTQQTLQKANQLSDTELLSHIAHFYEEMLKKNPVAEAYLTERGITSESIHRFRIGFAPNQWDAVLQRFKGRVDRLNATGMTITRENSEGYYDRFRNRIMFPIHNTRGQIVGFGGRVLDDTLPKYLNSPETELFQKHRELYGWHEALQGTQKLTAVVIVEGYLDVISLAQHGVTEAVATLGTATSSEHIQKIARQCQTIIFCFDGDRAGREAAWRALNNALPVLWDGLQLSFLFLPEGEDPDSFVQKKGGEAFRALYKTAIPFSEYFFQKLTEDCPTHLAEGRAKLAQKAAPLLLEIPKGILFKNLCDTLIQISKIDQPTLKNLLRLAQKKQHIPEEDVMAITKTVTQPYRIQLTPMRLAIALLLQHPSLAENAEFFSWEALPKDQAGVTLFQELLALCRANPKTNTAALLEHWREKPEFSFLNKLAAIEYECEEASTLLTAWKDALNRLLAQTQQNRADSLVQKMKRGTLTPEEKTELLDLIHLK